MHIFIEQFFKKETHNGIISTHPIITLIRTWYYSELNQKLSVKNVDGGSFFITRTLISENLLNISGHQILKCSILLNIEQLEKERFHIHVSLYSDYIYSHVLNTCRRYWSPSWQLGILINVLPICMMTLLLACIFANFISNNLPGKHVRDNKLLVVCYTMYDTYTYTYM